MDECGTFGIVGGVDAVTISAFGISLLGFRAILC